MDEKGQFAALEPQNKISPLYFTLQGEENGAARAWRILNARPVLKALGMSDLITTTEAAQALSLHRTTITRLCREGKLKAYRYGAKGTHWRVSAAHVAQLLAAVAR